MMKPIVLFMLCSVLGADAQSRTKSAISGVSMELTDTPLRGQLHWRIDNKSAVPVYVYSFYLWGPAYTTEVKSGVTVLETSPTAREGGCPNRFPPVLLLLVPPGDYREGDFRDKRLWELNGKSVALEIGVGSDPYSVVNEAEAIRWKGKDCSRSPMDAIWEWSTLIESNSVHLSEAGLPGAATTKSPGDTLLHEGSHVDPPRLK